VTSAHGAQRVEVGDVGLLSDNRQVRQVRGDLVRAALDEDARLTEVVQRTDAALADVGLTARDLGVLRVIAGGEARSQQEVAAVLGVDRTSMVALLDALERRGIVARKPSEHDRRRNVVELTQDGRNLFQRAEQRNTEVEQAFTAALGDAGRAELRRALQAVLDVSGRS